MLDIEISESSGFCFGVVNAIDHAEKQLNEQGHLCSLGEIVHNSQEVSRLSQKGLQAINYQELEGLRNSSVLFRAHGEAPWVYELAKKNGIKIIDATCPVVLQLQRKIRKTYLAVKDQGGQIVIFGKKGHAEVNGLVGQTDNNAIIVESPKEVKEKIDASKKVYLFSQTTMSRQGFDEIQIAIKDHLRETVELIHYNTICSQVSNRLPDLVSFAKSKDWIYFIAGHNSSNGKVLFHAALDANPQTVFISSADDIVEPLPAWVRTVGISGATSTPRWLMEEVAEKISLLNKQSGTREK